ncbi:4921_t:CDS:2, partial [Funneliformis mosseae]
RPIYNVSLWTTQFLRIVKNFIKLTEVYEIDEDNPIGVRLPDAEHQGHIMKRRKIECKEYKSFDDKYVQIPLKIFNMLSSSKFAPDPRVSLAAIKNLQVGQHFVLPNFGQEPKHFSEGYLGRKLYVTNQMINVWNDISKDQLHSFKRVLSGPMGVGKSYIALYLAARAYAEGWLILYIADAAELDVDTPEKAGKVICEYFLALNRDIVTGDGLEMLVENVTFSSEKDFIIVAEIILGELPKQVERKTLFVIDEHGVLFEEDPPVPKRLHLLSPLMNLTFWAEHYKGVRVIFTGISHAKYEMKYMKNGQNIWWVIYISPLEDNVFDILLVTHPLLKKSGIKEKVKEATNCIPHVRTDQLLNLAQEYYNGLEKNSKNRYYDALTSIFLPNKPTIQFDWHILDLGLIYRFHRDGDFTRYLPICPPAQKAFLKMYKSFDLPKEIKYQLNIGKLSGPQFEEALFNRLVSRSNTTILLQATDLNNRKTNPVKIEFEDYAIIKQPNLSLGSGCDEVLGRGFDGYPRFDFMLGTIFIQVSISSFTKHNNESSKNIEKAFEPMLPQAGITANDINGRNQIEIYLDEIYGPTHSARIDPISRKFNVSKNGKHKPGFRIVYIRGSPGTAKHSTKGKKFPEIAHVTFDEIKRNLFQNVL